MAQVMDGYELREARRAVESFPAEDLTSALNGLANSITELLGYVEDLDRKKQEGVARCEPSKWVCSVCDGTMSAFPNGGWFHRCAGARRREGT